MTLTIKCCQKKLFYNFSVMTLRGGGSASMVILFLNELYSCTFYQSLKNVFLKNLEFSHCSQFKTIWCEIGFFANFGMT